MRRMVAAGVVAVALAIGASLVRPRGMAPAPAVESAAPVRSRSEPAPLRAPVVAPSPRTDPVVQTATDGQTQASSAAAPTLRDYIEHGDPRSPPIVPGDVDAERPTAYELAHPDAYARFESRQHERELHDFATDGRRALAQWRGDRARAAAQGATPAQLREADDKIRHLEDALERFGSE